MATIYPYPEYKGAPTSWYNQYLDESMGVGDYFTPATSIGTGPAAEYGMTSEELEEELRRIDRQRLAGVMDSRPDTGPLFTPRPMIERQFARPIERPKAATRGVRKAVPPVSLLQDPIVDPTDLLPQQSTTLIGSRSVDRSPADIKVIGREVKAKKPKQRATNPADLRMPVAAPQAPAALLDTAEPSAEPGTSWYDDPMRMGLIQAGLGLLSAPQYSTNMNDVAFFPTAARGISGFLQGYGGTKERLAEEERQKLEDEYKRSQIEFDKLYKTALTNEAIGRTEQMQALLEQPAKDQKEWERRVREIYPGENNATAKKLFAAGPVKGPALLKDLLPGVRRTETERTQLINSVNNNKILGADKKKELIEMINETDKNGFTSSYSQIQTAIKNAEEKIQPKPPNAPKLSDNFRILLQEDMNESNPQAQIAFGEEYLKSYDRRTSYDEAGSKIEVPVYQNIPAAIREKYPNLARQQDELVASQQASVTRPNQTVIQANAVYEELSAIENRIQETGADTPLSGRYQIQNEILNFVPFGQYAQSDEYRQKMTLQNEWIESVLRDVSGAAIGVSEYDNYRAIYFPIAGDSEQMIQARRLARMRALKERERVALGLQGFRDPQKAANDHISGVSTQTTGVTNPTVDPAMVDGLDLGPADERQYD